MIKDGQEFAIQYHMDRRFGSPIRGWSYAFDRISMTIIVFGMAVLFGRVMLKVSHLNMSGIGMY